MENPLPFKTPFTLVITGCTGSGKSYLISRLLEERTWCFDQPVQSILYFYAHHQPLYEKLEETLDTITFYNQMPTEDLLEQISDPHQHDVIVIDDFGRESAQSDVIESLFTRGSHHMNISIINIGQSLYYYGRQRRTQALNTHYNIFMRNPAGADQIRTFARQRYPGCSKEFLDTYFKVTATPYSSLLVDASPKSNPNYSIRTGLFPESDIIVYQFP